MYSLKFVTWTWKDSCLYVRILVFNFPRWKREYSIPTCQAGSLSATTVTYSFFVVFLGFLILFFTVERKITELLYQITRIFLVLYQRACWTETYFLKIPACTHAKSPLSCPTLCDSTDHTPPGPSIHRPSPGKNTGVGCHALLQGIFLIQGSNPHLLCLLLWQVLAPPFNSHCISLFHHQSPQLLLKGESIKKPASKMIKEESSLTLQFLKGWRGKNVGNLISKAWKI